ncbi:tetratricopeptide repeat protein [Corynebacterium sp. 320]|uniref:tetratricopeptide repeat protein n=1 Tax=Corynebacterium TaxID=1716 RepID=UPI00125CBEE6|nr:MULTISPECIES: tetratricopeptide repeat protein [Corynebacterium]KAB1503570.1 tetratricopeptide repeat protein [Corynebacterium sp. 320]KAB1553329.1 tetratricopeptide repeat protein [Corynebacterium sp. 321]KAB1553453.1 tetratricopeptide repeat protein [Corynebacterium sp. 319]KAB3527706.1 tetratricopeptide repeat protein [Corynebacterium sp. 250]KAB3540803.1 tetratricopeptide repeat protein [Corynebacterium sp. 366]
MVGEHGNGRSHRGNSHGRGGRPSSSNGRSHSRNSNRHGPRNKGGFTPNRGGARRDGVDRARAAGPQRSGYREERIAKRMNEPTIPEDINPKDLDPSVRQELRSLSKDNADMVAKHLIMTALLLDNEPEKALEHARAAKDRAGRVAVARETCGIAAYHCGEWKEAISELRAARRMSGGPGLVSVLADAERGLGRPEKALEVAGDVTVADLDAESQVELAIVVSGAHQDMGNLDQAVEALEGQLDNQEAPEVSRMRLFYAYADALAQQGRKDDAITYFTKAQELDTEKLMDAAARIEELS